MEWKLEQQYLELTLQGSHQYEALATISLCWHMKVGGQSSPLPSDIDADITVSQRSIGGTTGAKSFLPWQVFEAQNSELIVLTKQHIIKVFLTSQQTVIRSKVNHTYVINFNYVLCIFILFIPLVLHTGSVNPQHKTSVHEVFKVVKQHRFGRFKSITTGLQTQHTVEKTTKP